MAKKSLGYTRTQWTCPNCETRNPGPQKTCSSCGMAQPDDVEFEQAAQEKIITDEAEIAKAKAGPDIQCYYCGARNPGGSEKCTQCGGDLTEGEARKHGEVMGAHRDKAAANIVCDACGAENKADASKCVQCGAPLGQKESKPEKTPTSPAPKRNAMMGIIVGAFVLLCCVSIIIFIVLSSRTSDVTGTVQDAQWTRTIAIEVLQPVEREAWQQELPAEAIVGVCVAKSHHMQDTPTENSKEVCGTPYSVDEGSGFAEVVQDCRYEVYEDWCKYTVDEWQVVDEVTASGGDLNPQWPAVGALEISQREGTRKEVYKVTFNTESGPYTFSPNSESEFDQYQVGSRWILKINTFGAVTDAEPM